MKKILFLGAIAAISTNVQAQNLQNTPFSTQEVSGTLIELNEQGTGSKGTATESNWYGPNAVFSSAAGCSRYRSISYDRDNTIDSGYVAGGNFAGVKGNGRWFQINTTDNQLPATLDSVSVIFGTKTVGVSGTIKIDVYDYNTSSRTLGSLLGSSNTVNVANIDTTGGGRLTNFFFNPKVNLTSPNVAVIVSYAGLTGGFVSLTSAAVLQGSNPCAIDTNRALIIAPNNSAILAKTATGIPVEYGMMAKFTETVKASIGDFGAQTVSLKAYPQPATESMTVEFQPNSNGVVTLNLVDVTGRIVATQQVEGQKAQAKRVVFNTNGLNSGVYFVQLNGQEEKGSLKVSIH